MRLTARRPGLGFDVRPLEEAVPLYVDWLAAIPLLKAAPEPDQLADRLDGGPWRGLELCLARARRPRRARWRGRSRSSRAALDGLDMAVTAEAR